MQKIFASLFIFITLITLNPSSALAEDKPVHLLTQTHQIEAKALDPRAIVLKDYLAKHNSPMQDNAQDFIDAADKYGVDWKLVPAIAGVESTFGKRIPGGYNAYGWGVYGDNAIYFKSWKDGIYTLNKGLKENYINKGLTNPYAMNRVYAASPRWGGNVSYFIADIEKFSQNYNLNVELPEGRIDELSKVYTSSAKLALK